MTKIDQPRSVGGPLRTSVSLRIFGERLDPEDVTAALGCPPTQAYRKGDRVGPRTPNPRNKGMWLYRCSTGTLDAQLRAVLGILPEQSTWECLVAGQTADVYCTAEMDGDVGGLFIDANLLTELGRRGIGLNVEIYQSPEPNPNG